MLYEGAVQFSHLQFLIACTVLHGMHPKKTEVYQIQIRLNNIGSSSPRQAVYEDVWKFNSLVCTVYSVNVYGIDNTFQFVPICVHEEQIRHVRCVSSILFGG
jgi:hypothetical protein